jgi:hypothetical protein
MSVKLTFGISDTQIFLAQWNILDLYALLLSAGLQRGVEDEMMSVSQQVQLMEKISVVSV